jgi:hypothetical protein
MTTPIMPNLSDDDIRELRTAADMAGLSSEFAELLYYATLAAQSASDAQPVAWLCELAMEDGTTRTQFVTEDPDGLRWNDAGEPSPYRTTPLYAAPKEKA